MICVRLPTLVQQTYTILPKVLHLKSQQRRSAGIRTWLSADQSSSSKVGSLLFVTYTIIQGIIGSEMLGR